MHKKKLVIVAFAVMLVILLLSLYYIQNIYHNTAGNTVQGKVNNDLQLSMTLNANSRTFKQGSEIFVTVTLTNIGHKALNVTFDANSYLGFDVRNSENVSVWTEEEGNTTVVTLAPQRSVNDTFNWYTGNYRYATQAPLGVYQLVGFFVAENNFTNRFQTAPVNITIVQGS